MIHHSQHGTRERCICGLHYPLLTQAVLTEVSQLAWSRVNKLAFKEAKCFWLDSVKGCLFLASNWNRSSSFSEHLHWQQLKGATLPPCLWCKLPPLTDGSSSPCRSHFPLTWSLDLTPMQKQNPPRIQPRLSKSDSCHKHHWHILNRTNPFFHASPTFSALLLLSLTPRCMLWAHKFLKG